MMGFKTVTCYKSKRTVIHSIKGFDGMDSCMHVHYIVMNGAVQISEPRSKSKA